MPHIAHVPADITGLKPSSLHHKRDGLTYLSRPLQLSDRPYPSLMHKALLITSLSIIGFVVWAAYAPISEVARAPGEIIPLGRTRIIQHMDGGMIQDIHVRERQSVKAGQLLITLDGAGSTEDMREVEQARIALQLKAERLEAFLNKRDPDFTHIHASKEAISREKKAFASMQGDVTNESLVLQEQLAQKIDTANLHDAQQATHRRTIGILGKEVESLGSLYKKGLITESRWLDAQRRLSDAQGNLATALSAREQAGASINEYKQRIVAMKDQRGGNAMDTLIETRNQLSQLDERQAKLQQRVERLDVRSPVTGIIKGLDALSVGSVIKQGQPLFEIVPTDDTLIADIRIAPQDIGHIRQGQPVRLKISTYDFARYGAMNGTLDMISATTFDDESGKKYFSATVTLNQSSIQYGTQHLSLIPGMTVEADIITGKKSVLGYLLKPVRVALDGALSER